MSKMIFYRNQTGSMSVILAGLIIVSVVLLFVFQNFVNRRISNLLNLTSRQSTNTEISPDQWISYETLVQQERIKPAGQLFEVNLISSQALGFTVTSLNKKNGYSPKKLLTDSDYFLVLKDSNGNVLNKTGFIVPNKISGPPPLPGDSGPDPVLEPQDVNFTITTEWSDGITLLEIVDLSDKTVYTQKITAVNTSDNNPDFKSIIRPGDDRRSVFRIPGLNLLKTVFAQSQNNEKVDITFIGNGYSGNQKEKFLTDATNNANYLLTYEPFKSRPDDIAFHYVDNQEDLNCQAFERLLYCDYGKVTRAVNNSGAPYDKIVVLVNTDVYGGSATDIAYAYNGYLGKEVFVHEFGHTFARLNDEYVSGGLGYSERNCYSGTLPNPKWEGVVGSNEYFEGCSFGNWHRSSGASIMMILSAPYFNTVSQKWISYYLDLFTNKPASEPFTTQSVSPSGSPGSSSLPSPSPSPSPQSSPVISPLPSPSARFLYPSSIPSADPNPSVISVSDGFTNKCQLSESITNDQPSLTARSINVNPKYHIGVYQINSKSFGTFMYFGFVGSQEMSWAYAHAYREPDKTATFECRVQTDVWGGSFIYISDRISIRDDIDLSKQVVNLKVNGQDGPVSVDANSPLEISWETNYSDTCTASGGWSGSKPLNGKESLTGVSSATTFTLECKGKRISGMDLVKVNPH